MSDHSITSLIEKLEGAEAGSVELSCDIGIALGEWTPPKGAVRDPQSPDVWRRDGIKHYQPYAEATTSLDAALALAERVLPGWEIGVRKNHDGTAKAYVSDGGPIGMSRFKNATSKTLSTALCAAVLRATGEDSGANEGEGR